jgi:hypothetical protein
MEVGTRSLSEEFTEDKPIEHNACSQCSSQETEPQNVLQCQQGTIGIKFSSHAEQTVQLWKRHGRVVGIEMPNGLFFINQTYCNQLSPPKDCYQVTQYQSQSTVWIIHKNTPSRKGTAIARASNREIICRCTVKFNYSLNIIDCCLKTQKEMADNWRTHNIAGEWRGLREQEV